MTCKSRKNIFISKYQVFINMQTDRQTDRYKDRKRDRRQITRWKNRKIDRQIDKQSDRYKDGVINMNKYTVTGCTNKH